MQNCNADSKQEDCKSTSPSYIAKIKPVVKYDVASRAIDDRSFVSYNTMNSMISTGCNPSSAHGPSIATSKMAMHCDYLA